MSCRYISSDSPRRRKSADERKSSGMLEEDDEDEALETFWNRVTVAYVPAPRAAKKPERARQYAQSCASRGEEAEEIAEKVRRASSTADVGADQVLQRSTFWVRRMRASSACPGRSCTSAGISSGCGSSIISGGASRSSTCAAAARTGIRCVRGLLRWVSRAPFRTHIAHPSRAAVPSEQLRPEERVARPEGLESQAYELSSQRRNVRSLR